MLYVLAICMLVFQPTLPSRSVQQDTPAEPVLEANWQWLAGVRMEGLEGFARVMICAGEDLIVGGDRFNRQAGVRADGVIVWSGTGWSTLGGVTDQEVRALANLSGGEIVAGGRFKSAGGIPARGIARWNGRWEALGDGVDLAVNAIVVDQIGNVFAGGYFKRAGDAQASSVARWDGKMWSALGSGVGGAEGSANKSIFALAFLRNGDLVAAGDFKEIGGIEAGAIARWNGSKWSSIGNISQRGNGVRALAILPNGDLVAGGDFQSAGGIAANSIARWDGEKWLPLGNGLVGSDPLVSTVTVLPDEGLVAGGSFQTAGNVTAKGIAHWNGKTWNALEVTANIKDVVSIVIMSNGDVVAACRFLDANEQTVRGLFKWKRRQE